MNTHILFRSFQAIAKCSVALVMGVVMLLSTFQSSALANTTSLETEFSGSVQIARAASSRFAAQAESEGQESFISESKLDEMRAKRRDWQREASATASEAETETEESVGEAVKDKLNLEEITEENEIVDELAN